MHNELTILYEVQFTEDNKKNLMNVLFPSSSPQCEGYSAFFPLPPSPLPHLKYADAIKVKFILNQFCKTVQQCHTL